MPPPSDSRTAMPPWSSRPTTPPESSRQHGLSTCHSLWARQDGLYRMRACHVAYRIPTVGLFLCIFSAALVIFLSIHLGRGGYFLLFCRETVSFQQKTPSLLLLHLTNQSLLGGCSWNSIDVCIDGRNKSFPLCLKYVSDLFIFQDVFPHLLQYFCMRFNYPQIGCLDEGVSFWEFLVQLNHEDSNPNPLYRNVPTATVNELLCSQILLLPTTLGVKETKGSTQKFWKGGTPLQLSFKCSHDSSKESVFLSCQPNKHQYLANQSDVQF